MNTPTHATLTADVARCTAALAAVARTYGATFDQVLAAAGLVVAAERALARLGGARR